MRSIQDRREYGKEKNSIHIEKVFTQTTKSIHSDKRFPHLIIWKIQFQMTQLQFVPNFVFDFITIILMHNQLMIFGRPVTRPK